MYTTYVGNMGDLVSRWRYDGTLTLSLVLSKEKRVHSKSLRKINNSNNYVPVLSNVDNSTFETTKKVNRVVVSFV